MTDKAEKPKGSRNRLSAAVVEAMLQVFEESPTSREGPPTKGVAALRTLFLTDAAAFAKLYAGVVPKEHWFDNLSELADAELTRVIEGLRDQIKEEQAPPRLVVVPAPRRKATAAHEVPSQAVN